MKNTVTGIPERLKQLRREKGITQTELAAELGVQRASVANWETGVRRPRNNAVTAICRYFDVTPDYLCGQVEARNLVIAPPVFHINMSKLNYDGQKELNTYYEYLLSREEFTK